MNRIHLDPNHIFIKWASLILLAIFFITNTTGFAQHQSDNPSEIDLWTFMVYLDGDNELEQYGVKAFKMMSDIGSISSVNILVQFDRISGFDKSYDDWTTTKRYYVTNGMDPNIANALPDLGEVNMGDPHTLIDFIQWGITQYPAEHYAVVLWDHGSGWKSNTIQLTTDYTNGFDGLEMPELRSAFSTLTNEGAHPIDLIGFDACLMAMIEVDNQIIPYGLVRVGSEETVPLKGWPYDDFLASLISDPSMSPADLGHIIVQNYYDFYSTSFPRNYTLSAVHLNNPYTALNNAMDTFAQTLIGGLNSYRDQINDARSNSQNFLLDSTYLDLYDFAYQVNQLITNTPINSAANKVMSAVDAAVIYERHGSFWSGAHGISIYFPASVDEYDSRYDGFSNWMVFTANNHWDELLRAYFYIPDWSTIMFMPVIANR